MDDNKFYLWIIAGLISGFLILIGCFIAQDLITDARIRNMITSGVPAGEALCAMRATSSNENRVMCAMVFNHGR